MLLTGLEAIFAFLLQAHLPLCCTARLQRQELSVVAFGSRS